MVFLNGKKEKSSKKTSKFFLKNQQKIEVFKRQTLQVRLPASGPRFGQNHHGEARNWSQ